MTNEQTGRNGGKNAVIYRKYCLPELRTKYNRRRANQIISTRTTVFRRVLTTACRLEILLHSNESPA